jgi:hypothetical protein
MKHLALPLLFSLFACGTTKVPLAKIPTHASPDECDGLYQHILGMSADTTIDVAHTMSKAKREAGITLIHQEMQNNGTTAKFFAYCINRMTSGQVNCALQSDTLSDMSVCRLSNK